jgi:cell division septal protein FtsQ
MKKRKKIDYSQKNLRNPFRKKTKKKTKQDRAKLLKFILVFFISVVSISSLSWFFIFSNFWTLKKIEVSGLSRIDKNEIKEIVYKEAEGKKYFIIPSDNILFTNKDNIEINIRNKYHFENIKISSDWPDMITVKIKENKCAYILKQAEAYYKVDSNNFIISSFEDKDRKNEKLEETPLIENKKENIIDQDKINISPDYVEYIRKVNTLLRQRSYNFDISKYIIDEESKNDDLIKAKIENGPIAYFNTKNDPEGQFKKLILVKDELGDDFWNKSYINLEFGDKVFYQ